MMAATFAAIALIPGIEQLVVPFVIIYGISYFFTEFGPNATTFVYPAEIFPAEVRTTGHGIAAAMGKLGGFIGVFLFPILMQWNGLFAAELAAAIVSIFGLLVTIFCLSRILVSFFSEVASDWHLQELVAPASRTWLVAGAPSAARDARSLNPIFGPASFRVPCALFPGLQITTPAGPKTD